MKKPNDEQLELKLVRDIYRTSDEWAGFPVFASVESATTYSNLYGNIEPYKSNVYSYENRLEGSFHEETPFGLEVPEGFRPQGSIIAAESRNAFLGFFFSKRDVEIHRKERGNQIKTYIIPVLDLENKGE